MGYVESLIALMVAGIACVALLSIATSVLRESKNNEMRDAMTQFAAEGLERVRREAETNIYYIEPPGAADGENFYCLDRDEGCQGDCWESGDDGCEVRLPFHRIEGDRCSQNSNGECGKIALNEGEDPLFYREIGIKWAGCNSVEVTVYVGFLEEGRNLARETEMSGFIGGIPAGDCSHLEGT